MDSLDTTHLAKRREDKGGSPPPLFFSADLLETRRHYPPSLTHSEV